MNLILINGSFACATIEIKIAFKRVCGLFYSLITT